VVPLVSAAPEHVFLVEDRCEVGPDGPRLLVSCCQRCGRYAFPARRVCPRCKLRSMASVKLGQRGTLYSFTVCHVAPEGWKAPYLQAYIQLPEGLRIFSLISSSIKPTAEALRVGMPMELVVEPVQPGSDVLTFKYRPGGGCVRS
jgi:benzoylsuccinyl-CoA thiolase BbsA subunit